MSSTLPITVPQQEAPAVAPKKNRFPGMPKVEWEDEMLEEAILTLLNRERHYGAMLMEVSYMVAVTEEDKDCTPTASIDKTGMLRFNSDFLAAETPPERIGTIKHELFHLILNHPGLMAEHQDKDRFNVACDLAINQYIPEIPQKGWNAGLFPAQFKTRSGKPMPLDRTAEEYYELLPDSPELEKIVIGLGGQGIGNGTLPQHSWELSKEAAEAISDKLESVLDKNVTSISRGSIPGCMKTILDKITRLRQVNWKTKLRKLAKAHLRGGWKTRWKKPDRRTGQVPCRTRDKKPLIGVAIDTSGSTMGYRDIFMGELDTIRTQTGCDLVVVECDAYVGANYVVKSKSDWKVDGRYLTGGGGTCFQPAIDWFTQNAKKYKIGCLIYLTDGYGERPGKNKEPDFPVIWVECGWNPPDSAEYGEHIKIRPEDLKKS